MRDKLDWHVQSALDAGQPEEHAFVHIACFLHWLGVRGWLEPGIFSVAERKRIADGSIELDDLIALTDEQLVAEMATTEGAGFGEARYDAYLERWGAAFPELENYTVPWTAETRARVTVILDELYAAWKSAGGLKPVVDEGVAYHAHPEVEHLVPDRIGDQLLAVGSFSATLFGLAARNPLVAGLDLATVAVAHASHRFGRTSRDSLSIDVMVIPGRTADELRAAGGGMPAWSVEPVGARTVEGIEVGVGRVAEWWMAWWFRDERLAQVMARTRGGALALVAPTDATMTAPATVVPAAEEAASDDEPAEWSEDRPEMHVAPDLEAMLPASLGGRRGEARSFELPPEGGPLPHGVTSAQLATVHLEPGVIATIRRFPGADTDAMAPMIDQSWDIPPKARRSQRTIGGRDVAWFEGRGLITAIWVRDDMLCTVNGYAGEAVVLEAIDQMP